MTTPLTERPARARNAARPPVHPAAGAGPRAPHAEPPLSIGMLSTHPPTQCGLATFSAALGAHLAGPGTSVGVVRVVDQRETHPGPEVVSHLVNGSPRSAADAVRTLDGFDAVVVQHEYGIYGGPDGRDVLEVVEALTVPTVVVLHTVLTDPSPSQREILLRLLAAADAVVTMTDTARRRLLDHYGVDPADAAARISVIPHGAAVHPVTAPRAGAADDARPLVLTWGLLGPGKGIEHAIDAVAGLRDLHPRYLVIGKTHPKVAEQYGEEYREGLRERIAAHDVGDLVELDDRYPSVAELAELVAGADVVLLPYDSRDQVTSGVLIEAVAAGRPVVSTAFPHAVELLLDGPGLVVPQGDPVALEHALRRVLAEPGLAERLAAAAAVKSPELLWGAVAARYRAIVAALRVAAPAPAL